VTWARPVFNGVMTNFSDGGQRRVIAT
jgi:hypothetical protein